MKTYTIVWDFDGTILPCEPYDSEQSLLIHTMNQTWGTFSWLKKVCTKAIIYADQNEQLRRTFKTAYTRLLKGTPSSVIDEVCQSLAVKISTAERGVYRQLNADGHQMVVLSCGTADLSARVLKFAGLENCFNHIEGNRFQFDKNRINGMQLRLPNPMDKLRMMRVLDLSPDRTIVIGDGYTDMPLLNWSAIPVLIDRSGKKKKTFSAHDFYFITAISQIRNVIETMQH